MIDLLLIPLFILIWGFQIWADRRRKKQKEARSSQTVHDAGDHDIHAAREDKDPVRPSHISPASSLQEFLDALIRREEEEEEIPVLPSKSTVSVQNVVPRQVGKVKPEIPRKPRDVITHRARQQKGWTLPFRGSDLVKGILYKEILSPPKALQRRRGV